MNNEDKLKEIFSSSLGIKLDDIKENLKYHSIPQWDSIAHMTLVAAIDDAFGTMLDTDDVINLSSFDKAKEILKKYGVDF